jgi:anaerobic selenocysteine-containing dehydrogenase
METTADTVRSFCRLCEAGCGLLATVEDGRLVQLRPDHDHPVTQGFACSKGLRAVDLHHDPDRVRRPQRRRDDRFEDVSWDVAVGEIVERLQAIIAEHGPRSVGVYLGNPNAFNALGSAAGMYFGGVLGTDRSFSAVTQDCSNKYAVAEVLYGTMSANPIPDLDRTELLLWIGSNPRVSKTSFFSVGDPIKALRRARDRGARVVFVDPLQIEPGIGETLQIRPDSDPYLLAAMLHEIHRHVGFRLGAMEGRIEGIDELVAFVEPYSPDAVVDVVGLPASTIARLARDFATADGASVHASTGLNMGRQGALAYWLVQMLLVVTGNLDRPGGNYVASRGFPMPAMPVDRTMGSFEESRWGSFRRSVGMLPSVLIPQYVADPDEPLRALFVLAGNPLLTVGGGPELEAALGSLDLLVSIDLYRNATGELADYVLPATDQFEREDLNVFVQGVQGRPFLQWSPKVVEPAGEQRQEWQIFGELLGAMGLPPLLPPDTSDPVGTLFDAVLEPAGSSVAALREAGGVAEVPEPGPGGSFDRIGVDGVIDAVPEALRPTLARGHELFDALVAEGPDQVKMITRRTRNTLNTWLQNLPSASPEGGNPLWMHPDHAAQLGLAEGDRAAISNDFGAIEAPVRHDPRLRPGVVAMTHGYGNTSTTGMSRALANPGVNVNALAPHGPGSFDPVSCMAQVTGIAVDVRRSEG